MMYEVIVCRCMVSLSATKKMNKLFCPMEDNVGMYELWNTSAGTSLWRWVSNLKGDAGIIWTVTFIGIIIILLAKFR
jgi:hypothetical protein